MIMYLHCCLEHAASSYSHHVNLQLQSYLLVHGKLCTNGKHKNVPSETDGNDTYQKENIMVNIVHDIVLFHLIMFCCYSTNLRAVMHKNIILNSFYKKPLKHINIHNVQCTYMYVHNFKAKGKTILTIESFVSPVGYH